MRGVFFIFVCLACWQCHSPQYSGKLREALELAGENRGELERVLAHYAGGAGGGEGGGAGGGGGGLGGGGGGFAKVAGGVLLDREHAGALYGAREGA